MGKPTTKELEQALAEAARLREQGEDVHHIAKALLNLNYRNACLEKVLRAAELYLRGLGEHEHTVLQKAIDLAHHEDERASGHDSDRLPV